MKLNSQISGAALYSMALLMTACGGAGDQAGSPTPFSVSPKEWTISTCQAGIEVTYIVYGGTAPYYLKSTYPPGTVLNKTKVDSRGDSFTVTSTANCVNPASIDITDSLGNVVHASFINGSS